jgi:hypothetical protein
MKPVFERDKLSIAKCRKILNVNGKNYSDEEIVKIRDWMYLYNSIEFRIIGRENTRRN